MNIAENNSKLVKSVPFYKTFIQISQNTLNYVLELNNGIKYFIHVDRVLEWGREGERW